MAERGGADSFELDQVGYDGGFYGGYDGALYGGAGESSSALAWGLVWLIVLALIGLVIWRMSDFRKDRLCISTDLRDYWPAEAPSLPGLSYLPALSQYLPRESLTTGTDQWRTDAYLMSANSGL